MTKIVAAFSSSASLCFFRVREFLAVAEEFHVPIHPLSLSPGECGLERTNDGDDCCFYFFETDVSADVLAKVAQRCILLRGLYVLLYAAPTLEALYTRGSHVDAAVMPESKSESEFSSINDAVYTGESELDYLHGDYCYHVETIGKKYSAEEKRTILDIVCDTVPGNPPPRAGRVSYTNPVHRFYVFAQHSLVKTAPGVHAAAANGPLLRVVYAVLLIESHRSELLHHYDLKRRPYIGTTSMPPEEALLMSNLARVQRGQLVYDPFCGTGSLLVAAAHYGAHTLASDVDVCTMRQGSRRSRCSAQMQQQRQLALSSRNAEELTRLDEQDCHSPTLWTNFKLYQLPVPDRIRMNLAAWQTQWRQRAQAGDEQSGDAASSGSNSKDICSSDACMFDVILSDPPYGIRESRVEMRKGSLTPIAAADEIAVVSSPNSVCAQSSPDSNSDRPNGAATAASSYLNSTSHSSCVHVTHNEPTQREFYSSTRIATDLVLFAAEKLCIGGHLCFWYATNTCRTEEELPSHPCMELLENIPQRLSLKVVRKLIVMRKTSSCVSATALMHEACAPRKHAVDLRTQMDVTNIPENTDYMHYRAKVQRKRLAAAAFHAQHDKADTRDTTCGVNTQSDTEGGQRGKRRGRGLCKDQDIMVANRLRNIRIRKEKQEASHRANAASALDAKQKRSS